RLIVVDHAIEVAVDAVMAEVLIDTRVELQAIAIRAGGVVALIDHRKSAGNVAGRGSSTTRSEDVGGGSYGLISRSRFDGILREQLGAQAVGEVGLRVLGELRIFERVGLSARGERGAQRLNRKEEVAVVVGNDRAADGAGEVVAFEGRVF